MMFITPTPPRARVMNPDSEEEVAHRVHHPAEHQRVDGRVPHPHRLAIVRIEVVPAREHRPHVTLERPVDVVDAPRPRGKAVRQLVHHPLLWRDDDVRDHIGLGVLARKIARHRGERHEGLVVVRPAIVAVLVLLPDLADDRVADPVQRELLAKRVPRAEQLGRQVGAEQRHAVYFALVLPVQLAAVLEIQGADLLVGRLDPVDVRCRRVVTALHLESAALQLRRGDGDETGLLRYGARIVGRQADGAAGTLASRLEARSPAPHDPDVLAELAEDVLVPLAEALTGCREDDDGDDAPEDPEHGQEAAELVGSQVLERLYESFSHRRCPVCAHGSSTGALGAHR
jgi:hypothetical protein